MIHARRTTVLIAMLALVLVVSACQWPSMRGGPTNAAFNADEATLSLADAGSVTEQYTADLGRMPLRSQTPVVVGNQVFAPSAAGLAVFDVNGVAGCGDVPTTCQPMWVGDVGGDDILTAATVAGSTVYVTARGPSVYHGSLFAFDVNGQTGCTPADPGDGSPKLCHPLWTADDVGSAAPVVDGSTLFATTSDMRIAAYDAAGQTGCDGIPRTCAPLWRTPSYSVSWETSPAVADGTVFATGYYAVNAFDASGVDGCSGVPLECSPLWVTAPFGGAYSRPLAPVVSGDRLYAAFNLWPTGPLSPDRTRIAGFALDGGDDCAPGSFDGVEAVFCQPEWTGEVEGSTSENEMAAAYGTLYHQTSERGGPEGSRLVAFDTDDPACAPGPCAPAWDAVTGYDSGAAAAIVANGTVYVDRAGEAMAVDAHGAIGCDGVPRRCTPATFAPFPGFSSSGWSVSNGKLLMITQASSSPYNLILRVFA